MIQQHPHNDGTTLYEMAVECNFSNNKTYGTNNESIKTARKDPPWISQILGCL